MSCPYSHVHNIGGGNFYYCSTNEVGIRAEYMHPGIACATVEVGGIIHAAERWSKHMSYHFIRKDLLLLSHLPSRLR